MVSRRKFTAEFKSKLALETLREGRTLLELAARYDVPPNMIRTWKRQAADGMAGIFAGKGSKCHYRMNTPHFCHLNIPQFRAFERHD